MNDVDDPIQAHSIYSVSELRRRSSLKWRRWPDSKSEVIPADYAEMDYGASPAVVASVVALAQSADFGYPDYDGGPVRDLKLAYTQRVETGFSVRMQPHRVEVLGQIIQGLCCCILAYTEKGDSVVLQKPVYPPIRKAVEALGREILELPTELVKGEYKTRTDALPGVVKNNTRLIVMCNPHNPTGAVLSEDDYIALAHVCRRGGPTLVVDEIHQDIIYSGETFRPCAFYSSLLEGNFVSLTSAAKSHNIPGLRCSLVYFGSRIGHEAFCRLPWHLRSGASLPGIMATIAAWRDSEVWLKSVLEYLAGNRTILLSMLSNALPEAGVTQPPATYFIWLDVRSLRLPRPREFFIEKALVAMTDGADFGDCGMLRFNYAMSRELLTTVTQRMTRAIAAEMRPA